MTIHITKKPIAKTLHQLAITYAEQVCLKSGKSGIENLVLHTYTDEKGVPNYWKIRLKNPDTGEKFIRAFSQLALGFQLKEPDFKAVYPIGNGKKPLYRLHELVSSDVSSIVFIVEGEQKADALAKLGLIATTSGGAVSINSTYWQSIAIDCKVRIWRDNDSAGMKYQNEVKALLESQGYTVSCIDVDSLGLPPKGDVVDWLAKRTASGLTTTEHDVLALPCMVAALAHNIPDTISDTTSTLLAAIKAEITCLARLPALEYAVARKPAAKKLGISVSELNSFVKAHQEQAAEQNSCMFADVEPWDKPVDGTELLDEIVAIVNRYIVCEQHTMHAVALWIMFSEPVN